MDGNNNQFGQQSYARELNEQLSRSYQQPAQDYSGQYGYLQYGAPQYVYPQYGMPQPPSFDQRAAKKHFSKIGMSYFVFWILTIIAGNAAALVLYFIDPDITDNYLIRILAAILPMYLIGAPVCWLMMMRVPAEKPEKTRWSFWQIVGGFIVAYSLMYLGSIIASYIGAFIESFFPDAQAATNDVQELVLTGEMWVNVLAMVMIGPVVEELLFRKLLCDRLKPFGDWVTIIVTGLMFGVFHGNITQGIYAFFFGAFLAYVYLRTGNILITIGYHVAANFMGSVLPLLVLTSVDVDGFDEILSSGDLYAISDFVGDHAEMFLLYGFYVMLILGLMAAGIVIVIVTLARRRVIIKPGRISIPSGKRFTTIIVNVGMILFLIGGIFEILYSTFG